MGKISPGAPVGMGAMPDARKNQAGIQQLHKRVLELERLLMHYKEELVVVLDSDGGGTKRTLLTKISGGGEVDLGNDVCPLGMWEADPNNLGRQRILQGFISGGGNNIELTYDNYTPVTGDSFYIEVSWTATVVDDVLVNGGIMTAASIQKTAGSVPGHVLPTKAAPSGTARIPLGTWLSSTQFAGNGCGGRNLAFCAEGGFQAWI